MSASGFTLDLGDLDQQDREKLSSFQSRNEELNNAIDAKLQTLNSRLNADHPRIIEATSLVFTRLNAIAAYIKGNYDSRCRQKSVRDEYQTLVKALDDATNALVSTVNGSEDVISDINMKVLSSISPKPWRTCLLTTEQIACGLA